MEHPLVFLLFFFSYRLPINGPHNVCDPIHLVCMQPQPTQVATPWKSNICAGVRNSSGVTFFWPEWRRVGHRIVSSALDA